MIRRIRRLLLVPAATLLLVGAPALAVEGVSTPAPTATDVPLVSALDSGNGPGWQAEAKVDANLVGVKWSGDPSTEFAVDVRTGNGPWTPAGGIGPIDVGPDPSSPDAASAMARDGRNATEPLWVGDADAVRVRVTSGSASDVSLAAVVAPGQSAPSGSAGALGVSLANGPDRFGYAAALVLAGLLLGAVALGWSPWRSRRQAAILCLLALFALAACAPPDPPPPDPPTPTPSGLPPQPAITMRGSWGARPFSTSSDCAPGPVIAASLKFAVVHHTVNSNTYGPSDSPGMVRAIQAYHMDSLGYCDIAYNFLIDRYGQIFEGRAGGIDKAVVAAHAGGFNTGSTGMSLIGTYTSEQPPQAQWDALVNLLAWKLSVHHVDPSKGFSTTAGNFSGSRWPEGTPVSFPNAIVGHRDVDFTECPGNAFYPRLGDLRNAVQPLIGWGSDPPATTAPPTTTTTPSTTTTTTH